ncbi:hypothetical protein BA011_30180 (plasmid) [Rhizobium leguminosarum]|uniref:Uncharacterized protein n=1 Tax=Rhizobium leguminosarum TaxID=384 RepID=A0A1B1CJJ7_RHILE|nr:hypothetical protein BA011_30180 [Rhizobium leguminosarum]
MWMARAEFFWCGGTKRFRSAEKIDMNRCKPPRDCQEFCAGCHDDEKERIITWLSKKNFWTSFLRDVIRPRFLGKDGLLDDLKRALSERILNAELERDCFMSVHTRLP